jgi:DNA-binding HxlR family transcriptional regulator
MGYDKRVAHYEDEEGLGILAELARARGGMSTTALLRQLTREEHERLRARQRSTEAAVIVTADTHERGA